MSSMGLFDAFRSKKKKQADISAGETDDLLHLDDVDLSGSDPPETRYTQEYQDFLADQEAAGKCGAPSEAESGRALEQE